MNLQCCFSYDNIITLTFCVYVQSSAPLNSTASTTSTGRRLSNIQPSTMRPPSHAPKPQPQKRPRGRPRKYPKEGTADGGANSTPGGPMRQTSVPMGVSPYVHFGVRPGMAHQTGPFALTPAQRQVLAFNMIC